MEFDEHLNNTLPFGKHQGQTIDRVMETDHTYLAWFVDNIARFKGHTPQIDVLVERIRTHPRFTEAYAAYQRQKEDALYLKAEYAVHQQDEKKRRRLSLTSVPKRHRGHFDERRGLFIPKVRVLAPSEIVQLYRWRFSEAQLARRAPELPLPTDLIAQVTFRWHPHLEHEGKRLPDLSGAVGWLVMRIMQVRLPPLRTYSIAAAITCESDPVDPYDLEQFFPYVSGLSSLDEVHCHMEDDVRKPLYRTLQVHKQASLRHWREERTAYLESEYQAHVEPLISLTRAREEEYQRSRRSRAHAEAKDRLRQELLAAEAKELEAQWHHSLMAAAEPELAIKTLFAIEWAVESEDQSDDA